MRSTGPAHKSSSQLGLVTVYPPSQKIGMARVMEHLAESPATLPNQLYAILP